MTKAETAAPAWVEWSPGSAAHVKGRYLPRVWDEASGSYERQPVEATCTLCGEAYAYSCDSGRVRERIANFALLHLHRTP